MKMRNIIKIMAIGAASALLFGCTNLDEELYGRLSPDTYYQNEDEALSSVVGVYSQLSRLYQAGGDGWRIGEYSTDELACPGRANGGWYDGAVVEIMDHACTQNNGRLQTCWKNNVFSTIGCANAVIASLESSPLAADLAPMIAEARTARAYAYYYAMDYWGNVPLFTGAKVNANNLPEQAKRADIFKFIETELTEAVKDLPSAATVGSSYYPRFTKEAAQILLAELYLNAEVYSGTARWNDCLTVCNAIIASGAFSLEDNVGDCFLVSKEGKSTEVIAALSVDPTRKCDGNQFILYAQHATDQSKYSLNFAPACGYCFGQAALDRYDDPKDTRLNLIEAGPQYYLDGTPIADPDQPGKQLVLTDIKSMTAAQNWEGYRVLKYSPVGAVCTGGSADNDYVMQRYSNVLMMKCECLVRLGQNLDVALGLINDVRTRSKCTPLLADQLTLKNIEKERANEFIWEGKRRSDMVRFGSFFTTSWGLPHPTANADKNTGLFPIPADQLNSNPKLSQNPGYSK